ncbi:MAG TPA: M23 family metallopeptidase [Sphingomonas sp.]|jgi:murein DD-endopeptidase MepM/ murein hydrolase activator NlpD|uniref:M23 family metallopeptidase n=1 Tax=Sphingomonas sp. TaxID=28214 RepID=UPI002ED7A519
MTFTASNVLFSLRFLAGVAIMAGCTAAQASPQEGAAMDGGYEMVDGDAQAEPADAQFHALFTTWKRADALNDGGAMTMPGTPEVNVPSLRPVTLKTINFTSGFGVRSDPFRHSAAMHAGIDLAGPLGTPIYATADGVVSKAGWGNGYGNMVEISHGAGMETRYGHMSKLLVSPNTRVHRGQLIGLMGSTGRSTGSHLHYEVRIDGRAVNPIPYLRSAEYAATFEQRATTGTQLAAVGGPTVN